MARRVADLRLALAILSAPDARDPRWVPAPLDGPAIDDPVRGLLRLVANPIRLSGTLAEVRSPPPRRGEHTEEVLRELDA